MDQPNIDALIARIVKVLKQQHDDPYLDTPRAAKRVRLSPRTLEKKRVYGDGPIFRKHGRYVVYLIDDLDAWSAARKRRSTSEGPPSRPRKPQSDSH